MKSDIKLYVYKGEWGLPSIDIDCLQALCTIKFIAVPVEINFNGDSFFLMDRTLPCLKDNNLRVIGQKNITEHLKRKGHSINSRLNKNTQFLSDAYDAMLFNNLRPYYYYVMFGDQQNMEEVRILYAKRIRFPFNFYYPGKIIKNADDILKVFCGFSIYDKKEKHNCDEMILNAKQCINILASKLGNQEWFFGSKPSQLDANVYSYLSVLCHISLPTNPLQLHIRKCSNLLKFINRITKNYFSGEEFKVKLNKNINVSNNADPIILTSSEKQFAENKRATQIFAFFGAFIVMSVYASWIGLFQISLDEQYDDQIFSKKENFNF